MNAVLDDRADLAGLEVGDGGIGGSAGAGDEEHVLAALYGDEAELDADADAALLVLPDVRGTSTGRNTDDLSQIAGRAVARGRTARDARR